MKKIISDSIWAHIVTFWLFINLALLFLSIGIINPALFVISGVVYVLIIFNSAMRIADFEMSEVGKLVNKIESRKYKEVHVTLHK